MSSFFPRGGSFGPVPRGGSNARFIRSPAPARGSCSPPPIGARTIVTLVAASVGAGATTTQGKHMARRALLAGGAAIAPALLVAQAAFAKKSEALEAAESTVRREEDYAGVADLKAIWLSSLRAVCPLLVAYSQIRGNLVDFFFSVLRFFFPKKRCKGHEKSQNSGLVQSRKCKARKTLKMTPWT